MSPWRRRKRSGNWKNTPVSYGREKALRVSPWCAVRTKMLRRDREKETERRMIESEGGENPKPLQMDDDLSY
ncbi:hypothetical protein PBY51_010093 [Eleginops maclovinus]|uniref:Uncharacterized protein n=1 Tax=Eleginops maclovinus TaxID=56733 RepID=A0AAN7XYA0_ELEMC|nr:hypothetical protein PBY51_010093 [Eleginops maclovinus]